jgi:hypothetical protein
MSRSAPRPPLNYANAIRVRARWNSLADLAFTASLLQANLMRDFDEYLLVGPTLEPFRGSIDQIRERLLQAIDEETKPAHWATPTKPCE